VPGRLRSRLPRDLETICLKCLQKDPHKRYSTAQALAEDLERYLAGLPIHARPVGLFGRLGRWCRRHPGVAALAALLVVIAFASFIAVSYNWLEAETQRGRAQNEATAHKAEADAKNRALTQARENLYFHTITLAYHEILANDVPRAEELLDSCPADLRNWEWFYLKRQCHTETHVFTGHTAPVRAIAFSCKGDWFASGDDDGHVKIWDIATGREIRSFQDPTGHVWALAFSPDGRRLAGVIRKRQQVQAPIPRGSRNGKLLIWDAATGEVVRELPQVALVQRLEFSQDGRRLAAAGDDVNIWDADTGQNLLTLPPTMRYGGAMAFHPAGNLVALAARDSAVKLWDVPSGRIVKTLPGKVSRVSSLAFDSRGAQLASLDEKTLRIWDSDTGALRFGLPYDGRFQGLAFSSDGHSLVTWSHGAGFRILDLQETGEPVAIRPNTSNITGVAVSPVAGHVAAGCADNTLRIWNLQTSSWSQRQTHLAGVRGPVAYSRNGRPVAASLGFAGAKLWNPSTGEEVTQLADFPFPHFLLKSSSDDRRLACLDTEGTVRAWETSTGRLLARFQASPDADGPLKPLPKTFPTPFQGVALLTISPDGRRLATVWRSRIAHVWEADTGKPLFSLTDHASYVLNLAFSADGGLLATASADKTVKLWEMKSGRLLGTLTGHRDHVIRIAFSPDGRRLASASKDTIKIWEPSASKEVLSFSIPSLPSHLVFSNDGKRLAVAGGAPRSVFDPGSGRPDALIYDERRLTLWDPQSGRPVLILPENRGSSTDQFFSPDGHTLHAVMDGGIRRWDASPLK
jgi:WD40 repeat protein